MIQYPRNFCSVTQESKAKLIVEVIMNIERILSDEFNKTPSHVHNIIALIDEGNTIPFIARYRKEQTGSCDDQVLRDLSERLNYLRNLEKRKTEVEQAIAEQGKLDDTLKVKIQSATTLAGIEDIYRPFKQKRRTRATVAMERGLEPLAKILYSQELRRGSMEDAAMPFVYDGHAVRLW